MSKKKRQKGKSRRPPRRRSRAQSGKPLSGGKDRVSRVRASAAAGESPEDRAIFDDSALKTLDGDSPDHAVAVREALELVTKGRDAEALERTKLISRRSPYADWRLLLRGLVDWYQDRHDEARTTFERLDPQRRPSRIASVLLTSARPPSAADDATLQADDSLARRVQMVRRIRHERPALAEARTQTKRQEKPPSREAPEVLLGPQTLTWLLEFSSENRNVEPGLVAALAKVALSRASAQPYIDIFEQICRQVVGPPHDPDNRLRRWQYEAEFDGESCDHEALAAAYLKSLEKADQLPGELKSAITSQVHLRLARQAVPPKGVPSFILRQIDETSIEKHFKTACQAAPGNAEAHRAHVQWRRESSALDSRSKATRLAAEARLSEAMRAWADGVPEATEPRLWLVNHYFEDDKSDLAEPYVLALEGSRSGDLEVRAIRWKWQLLEAMRLSRRKSWCDQVSEQLDAAEQRWPIWLGREWLPYLRAAVAFRAGNSDSFSSLRKDARQALAQSTGYDAAEESDVDLVDAVMMLGAAQRMRVPSASLKPFREPVDRAVTGKRQLSTRALVLAGRFFLDLHRAGLLYPAYRMHGGKFAEQLVCRVEDSPIAEKETWQFDDSFTRAMFWLGEKRWFTREILLRRLPREVDSVTSTALTVQAAIQMSDAPRLSRYQSEFSMLREQTTQQTDPYLRYWFPRLADKAEEKLADLQAGFGGLFGGVGDLAKAFARAMERAMGDEDEWDDEDELDDEDEWGFWSEGDPEAAIEDFDPACDCDHCTRVREQHGIPHPWDPASLYYEPGMASPDARPSELFGEPEAASATAGRGKSSGGDPAVTPRRRKNPFRDRKGRRGRKK